MTGDFHSIRFSALTAAPPNCLRLKTKVTFSPPRLATSEWLVLTRRESHPLYDTTYARPHTCHLVEEQKGNATSNQIVQLSHSVSSKKNFYFTTKKSCIDVITYFIRTFIPSIFTSLPRASI